MGVGVGVGVGACTGTVRADEAKRKVVLGADQDREPLLSAAAQAAGDEPEAAAPCKRMGPGEGKAEAEDEDGVEQPLLPPLLWWTGAKRTTGDREGEVSAPAWAGSGVGRPPRGGGMERHLRQLGVAVVDEVAGESTDSPSGQTVAGTPSYIRLARGGLGGEKARMMGRRRAWVVMGGGG